MGPDQLRVYQAVCEAQSAGIREVKAAPTSSPRTRPRCGVLADHLRSRGILPVTADVSCADDVERPGRPAPPLHLAQHVAHARRRRSQLRACLRGDVQKGTLVAGHVLTVEPGLYFHVNDRTVPDGLRGLAIRIEDDTLVTDGAPVNLSGSLPRDPAEVTRMDARCAVDADRVVIRDEASSPSGRANGRAGTRACSPWPDRADAAIG